MTSQNIKTWYFLWASIIDTYSDWNYYDCYDIIISQEYYENMCRGKKHE